nr:RNA-directed DNA polymerase, eukaryota [Tanacetum cinerariifolium]
MDQMPRGGVEQENYDLLCSKVTDLVLPNISDRWCLSLEGSQEFSVKSSRILIDNTILPKAEVLSRWLRVIPIKVNVHAWRVCLDKLPTRANLSLRGMDIPSIACPLCNLAVESSSHILFSLVTESQADKEAVINYHNSLIQESPSTSTPRKPMTNNDVAKRIKDCKNDEDLARVINDIRGSPTPSEDIFQDSQDIYEDENFLKFKVFNFLFN